MIKLTFTAQKSELISDIRNKTYIIGRQIEAADRDKYGLAEEMIASGDSWDEVEIVNCLNHALGILSLLAGEYLSTVATVGDYSVTVSVTDNFNSGVVNDIKRQLHSYLVAGAMSDWLSTHNMLELAKSYAAESQLSMETIISSLHQRVRPKRPE